MLFQRSPLLSDEAILFTAKQPDGSLYWHGFLLAKDGFAQFVPNRPGQPAAYPTNVEYIMTQQDVAIYNGHSNTFGVIGSIFNGQIAKVTATNIDGCGWVTC